MKTSLRLFITLTISSSANANDCFRNCLSTAVDIQNFDNCLSKCPGYGSSSNRSTNEASVTNSRTQEESTNFNDWDEPLASEIYFANNETCGIGGQSCNFFSPCCDGFSCQPILTSRLRASSCVPTHSIGDCRPYQNSCTKSTDCCDGLTCVYVQGIQAFQCLNFFETAET